MAFSRIISRWRFATRGVAETTTEVSFKYFNPTVSDHLDPLGPSTTLSSNPQSHRCSTNISR
jgi:hypothetical protein